MYVACADVVDRSVTEQTSWAAYYYILSHHDTQSQIILFVLTGLSLNKPVGPHKVVSVVDGNLHVSVCVCVCVCISLSLSLSLYIYICICIYIYIYLYICTERHIQRERDEE